jgi:anti-sigma regulatory factor (Ser/Thr protein kinase)
MITELSTSFAGGPYAAVAARRALGGLSDLIGHDRLEDVCLLVSELVTNGVRHAGATEDDELQLLAVRHGKRLRIEVTDRGPGFDGRPRPRNRVDQTGGWGLFLVERLADRWGVHREDDGNIVWFEVHISDAAMHTGGDVDREPVVYALVA